MKSYEALWEINKEGSILRSSRDRLLHVGQGVDIEVSYETNTIKPSPIHLTEGERTGHFGCFGTTRTGKTRFLMNMVSQDIKAGRNVVVIDPKGDQSLFSSIIQAAAESGRLDDLMLVTPIFPEHSLRIDPLAYYYMPDELVDHIISGIKAKDEYFINVAAEISTVIVLGKILMAEKENKKPRLNFYDIKLNSSREKLEELMTTIAKFKKHPTPKISRMAEEVCADIEQIVASPTDFFAKVSSSLRTTLTALTSSTTGQIIGKAYTNEFIKRFEEGRGVILLCNTGSLLSRRTAHIIGRVTLSMIQSTVGRFFASGQTLDPPLSVYVDEGHNVLYKGIQELFNKGGGAGVWLHFFTQSIAQIEEEIGPEATQSILDNMNTIAFMKVNHEKTAAYFEELTPWRRYYSKMISYGSGNMMSVTLREVEERMVLKDKLMQLPTRWFYLRKDGKIYKVTAPKVDDPYVFLKFPSIIGENPA